MASSPSATSPAPGDATAFGDTASTSRNQGNSIASEEAAFAPQITDNREISNVEPSATPPPAQDEPNDVHRCFICLEDEPPKNLPPDWVTPCTCSLEGHQQCMLTWVADLEAQGKDIKCPVCQSPIQVLDKWDPAVQFSDEIMRSLSNMSPFVLLSFLGGGALVSSAFYGMHALEIFAGPEAALHFVLKRRTKHMDYWSMAMDRVKDALPALIPQEEDITRAVRYGPNEGDKVNVLHFLSLTMIGPALILNRLYLGNFVIVPTSVIYAMFFVEHQSDLLTWPPGPRKAMAIFPTIKTLYLQAYWICAKMVDRRVEAALARNRSLQGETVEQAAAPQLDNAHVAPDEDEADLIDLAIAEEEEEAGEPQNGPAEAQARADRRANPNSSLSSVLNFFAGALLWPTVSYSVGNLLRMTLPKPWVTRPSTGPITEELSTDPIEE
ncbi:RING finger domain-containing protein [Apiospora rasikravindrae]|uniref:RING finger domain-containing protein n=1 Tax=Apiospora rasikravindrae TaxID=990691 RepID=A0ABR1UBH1_9PEZI